MKHPATALQTEPATPKLHTPGLAARHVATVAPAFLLILAGYLFSFSYDMNDSLDTARWMENGNIARLAEFRHLVQRMLPLYAWLELQWSHFQVSAIVLLSGIDFISAALSVLLFYRIVKEVTKSRPISFLTTFAYATAHCVWIYTGSGRLYSTSMLLVFAGYYLALRLPEIESERRRMAAAFAAGALICFASLFWLVHVFNAVGVGLLLLLRSGRGRLALRYALLYAVTGMVLMAAITVATVRYIEIPLSAPAIRAWIDKTETQPLKFNWQSPMNAAFGQANGILVMYELPYLINAFIRHDPRILAMASLPWLATKFVFVWMLLLLCYIGPFFLFRRADWSTRALIVALYVPLAMNFWFGLGWLGTDVQRFMPTMLSQFVLTALVVQALLRRVSYRRALAWGLTACVVFIAADNLIESLLPSQRRYIALERQMSELKPYLRNNDLLVNFGRDITISYLTMSAYYAGAYGLNLTNDHTRWNWDRPDWKQALNQVFETTWSRGGRVFVMDRLAAGFNPPVAAWNERQHPEPTVQELGAFLAQSYCVKPAFRLESSEYYQISVRLRGCASPNAWRAIPRHEYLDK